MKKQLSILAALCAAGLCAGASAGEMASYYERAQFLFAPPGSYGYGLVGFANPALPAVVNRFEGRLLWTTDGTDEWSLDDWGAFAAVRGLGFGMQRIREGSQRVDDYRVSLAGGGRRAALGIGYSWSRGDEEAFGRRSMVSVGILSRPLRFLSVGVAADFSTGDGAREGVFEAALRPFGTPLLTIFGDAAVQGPQRLRDAPWSAGAAIEPVPGLSLVARYFASEELSIGLSFDVGHLGLAGRSRFDANGNRTGRSYAVRAGDYVYNPLTAPLLRNRSYVPIRLTGRVDHLAYRLLDGDTHRLLDITRDIRAAAADPRVGTIALDLSAVRILPEHAWEVREELLRARKAGKRIVAFIDNAGMTEYHLASAADRIMLDPQGMIMLPGFVAGRTFLAGTLEKLGLGFDEWRFFEYKSAAEVLSRSAMSEADRRQRLEYIDDSYELTRREVCEERGLAPARFDSLVDDMVYFMPQEALAEGLVDTLCRWSDLGDAIESLTGRGTRSLPAGMLAGNAGAFREWGAPPRVAVVYALGECAMDEGINARRLASVFERIGEDRRVRAVVFRVDSPGGDGMASDVVAEALRDCAKRKPVIVSQGQVAASGGYWISMYADTIVAGPNTITGSIGVIGGWLYDRGASGKLGMTSDHVRRGAHADLGFGVTLPLLGLRIPSRNLSGEERDRMEGFMLSFYRGFVEKVADGRAMTPEQVDGIGQGRIYSGTRGREIGLVDEIGGLTDAIDIALAAAGIDPDREVELVEHPRYRGLIKLDFLPRPLGSELKSDPTVRFISLWSRRPGYPLPLLPPGTYPTID